MLFIEEKSRKNLSLDCVDTLSKKSMHFLTCILLVYVDNKNLMKGWHNNSALI